MYIIMGKWRDFTYIDDLIFSIISLKDINPRNSKVLNTGVSSIAPFRVINIEMEMP